MYSYSVCNVPEYYSTAKDTIDVFLLVQLVLYDCGYNGAEDTGEVKENDSHSATSII